MAVGLAVIGVIMFKERIVPLASYYLLRIMISTVLVWVAFACLLAVHRLWFQRTVTLQPFAYVKDGADAKDNGASFAQEVNQDLQSLQQLLKRASAPAAPDNDGRVRPETIYGLARESISLDDIEIPALSKTPLEGLEIQFQGIKVTDLFRSLMRVVHPPDELAGLVSELNGKITARVQLQHAFAWSRPPLPSQEARDHDNRQEASFAVACRILYLLAADRDGSTLTTFSPEELELYLRGLNQFSLYNTFKAEARPDPGNKKQEAALAEADRVLGALTANKTKFTSAYKLAALVAFAKNDSRRGEELLNEYLKRLAGSPTRQSDPTAQRFQKVVKPEAKDRFNPRERATTLQPGMSASSVTATAGTICCVVKDKSGVHYLLSSDHPFSGNSGTEVLQPSVVDGGSAPNNVVAEVTRSISKVQEGNYTVAGAIAKLRPDVKYDAATPHFKFAGTGTVQPGDAVRLVGRTSGLVKGAVQAINASVVIAGLPDSPQGTATFTGLVACVAEGGKPFSQPGDSGAPVVNAKSELVGMIYAGSETVSYFIPIEPLLKALEVELVK